VSEKETNRRRNNIDICTERAARCKAQGLRREITPKEKQQLRETFKNAIYEHDRLQNIKRGVR
jgi:hypothetical protein